MPELVPSGDTGRNPGDPSLFEVFDAAFVDGQRYIADYARVHYPDQMAGMNEEEIRNRLPLIDLHYGRHPIPTTLCGADNMIISMVAGPELARPESDAIPSYSIFLSLIRNGTLFSPDDIDVDLSKAGEFPPTELVLVIDPGQRPFLVNSTVLFEAPKTGSMMAGTPDAYLAQLESQGKEPRYLSPEEGAEMADILVGLPIDIKETFDQIGGSGFFPQDGE